MNEATGDRTRTWGEGQANSAYWISGQRTNRWLCAWTQSAMFGSSSHVLLRLLLANNCWYFHVQGATPWPWSCVPRLSFYGLQHPHPYTSERGGYLGWGLGVIGSDVVDSGFVIFSLIPSFHSTSRTTIKCLKISESMIFGAWFIAFVYITLLMNVSEQDGCYDLNSIIIVFCISDCIISITHTYIYIYIYIYISPV